jgi:hypothetical protein
MGGANPNDQITATHLDFNKGDGNGIPVASVDKKWDVQSAHPEAVTQGIIKGIGSLATSAIGAGAGAAAKGAGDATTASQATGNVGPVASSTPSPQGFTDAVQYMRRPSMQNYMDMNAPEKFSFNYNQ